MDEATLIQEGVEPAGSGDVADDMGDVRVHPYEFARGYACARLGRPNEVPESYSLAMAGAYEAGYLEGTKSAPRL